MSIQPVSHTPSGPWLRIWPTLAGTKEPISFINVMRSIFVARTDLVRLQKVQCLSRDCMVSEREREIETLDSLKHTEMSHVGVTMLLLNNMITMIMLTPLHCLRCYSQWGLQLQNALCFNSSVQERVTRATWYAMLTAFPLVRHRSRRACR